MDEEVAEGPAARRYSTGAVVLHWLIAAAILFQVGVGLRMEGPQTPERFAIFQLHKSVGITILVLSLARLGWRLAHPMPMSTAIRPWERGLASAVHVALYIVMIGMPLTGWLMVSASELRIPTLLYGAIPFPDIPGLHGLKAVEEAGDLGHHLLLYGFFGLFALHVAGALKHQLVKGDEPILRRMAPGARPGLLEPRLIAIVCAAVAAFAAGSLIRPPLPKNVVAAQKAAAPTAPAPAEAGAWAVQPGSTLSFTTGWNGKPIEGRFDRWRARIVFDPADLARARIDVHIDPTSIRTGDPQIDQAVLAGEWLDIAHHPEAVFIADRIVAAADGGYLARGQLNLRGLTKLVDLPFQVTIDGNKAHAVGETRIDRRDFMVGQGRWADTGQIPGLVRIRIDITALRR